MAESKWLYLIALLLAAAVAAFYYFSGKGRNLDSVATNQLSSSAAQLEVTQTDEQGQLALKAHIDQVTQWSNEAERTLAQNVMGQTYQHGRPDLSFSAQQASSTDHYRYVKLEHGVKLSRQGQATPSADRQTIQLETEQLSADTKSQQIMTQSPVLVQTPQAQFTANGLHADLAQGHYEFSKIRGSYAPQ